MATNERIDIRFDDDERSGQIEPTLDPTTTDNGGKKW